MPDSGPTNAVCSRRRPVPFPNFAFAGALNWIDLPSMARLETYQSNAAEAPVMRKWFLRAFLVSVGFHLVLAYFFQTKKLEQFTPQTDRLVPRVFTVKNVTIDPKLLDQEEEKAPVVKQQKAPPKEIELPPERPMATDKLSGDVRAAPTEAQPILLNDKPKVESSKMPELARSPSGSSKELDRELDSVRDQILKDQASTQSLLNLRDKNATTASGNALAGASGVGGFSNLDTLLDSGGDLKKGTAPILLPTDVLFEFNKADLLKAATESIRKLGTLIQKNPQVTFSIEGYTDSFGSPEHNAELSKARAEAVRQWLVKNMAINSEKIKTKGLGATRFLVAPAAFDWKKESEVQAEIERQRMNRRVEIVLTFPKE